MKWVQEIRIREIIDISAKRIEDFNYHVAAIVRTEIPNKAMDEFLHFCSLYYDRIKVIPYNSGSIKVIPYNSGSIILPLNTIRGITIYEILTHLEKKVLFEPLHINQIYLDESNLYVCQYHDKNCYI